MTKHTQGEWIGTDGQIYPEETGKTLALIPYYDKENEEQQANAQLIAAAPKMLLTLQRAVAAFYQYRNQHGTEKCGSVLDMESLIYDITGE